MKLFMRSAGYRALLAVAVTVPLLLALASAWLVQASSTETQEAMTRLINTRQVSTVIDQMLATAVDAETGQRGFVLIGDDEFLEPYHRAVGALPGLQQELLRRTEGDPGKTALARELLRAVSAKLDHARSTIELARTQGLSEGARQIATKRGKALMDDARHHAQKISAQNDRDLALHRQEYSLSLGRIRLVMAGMVVAQAAVFLIIGVLLWQVSHARALAVVCAWSRTVEYQGEWVSFEDYLFRRFGIQTSHGISPQEAQRLMSSHNTPRPR